MTRKKPPAKPDPFTRAVEIAGSENQLAKLTKCSQHAIWLARKKAHTSAEMALRIERATGVPARAFRPDLFEPLKVPKKNRS